MKGLLLKDLYLTLKYCSAFIIIIVIFTGLSFLFENNSFITFYPCLMAGMIPSTLYSYDERDKWCTYSAALPVSRTQLVSVKYIISLFWGLTATLFTAIIQAYKMINTSFVLVDYLSIMVLITTVCLVAPSIFMPFMFKLGAEKGRILYYVIIGATTALFVFLTSTRVYKFIINDIFVIAVFFIIAVVIYIASWLLSIKFYKKREF